MNPRTILLAVAALITAGITAFLVQGWMERQRAKMVVRAPAQAEGTNVLVAKSNLGAGSFVQPGDLRWQAWPEGNLSPSYAVKGKRKETDFVGSVVRKGIVAGQPITDAAVVKVGERGFLAAVLKPGLRAIAVPVNATSAIAGLVFPGDRVDLILTHKYQAGPASANGRKLRQASETLLTNVRILAIDQSTDDQKGSNGKKTAQRVPKTTTLEVTPKQVELVNVALTLGHLSLSLRSLAKDSDQNVPGPTEEVVGKRGRTLTRDSEVSGLLSGEGKQVTVLRGSGSKKK